MQGVKTGYKPVMNTSNPYNLEDSFKPVNRNRNKMKIYYGPEKRNPEISKPGITLKLKL